MSGNQPETMPCEECSGTGECHCVKCNNRSEREDCPYCKGFGVVRVQPAGEPHNPDEDGWCQNEGCMWNVWNAISSPPCPTKLPRRPETVQEAEELLNQQEHATLCDCGKQPPHSSTDSWLHPVFSVRQAEGSLGKLVRELRGGQTQSEFGKKFGVSHAAVSDWEREVSDVPASVTLALLARTGQERETAGRLDELEKLSMSVIEPCEPDCDDVRHALHQGSWNAHLVIENRLAALRASQAEGTE